MSILLLALFTFWLLWVHFIHSGHVLVMAISCYGTTLIVQSNDIHCHKYLVMSKPLTSNVSVALLSEPTLLLLTYIFLQFVTHSPPWFFLEKSNGISISSLLVTFTERSLLHTLADITSVDVPPNLDLGLGRLTVGLLLGLYFPKNIWTILISCS